MSDSTKSYRTITPRPGFVPPYILEHVAVAGTKSQRQVAFRTLALSERFHGTRQAIGPVSSAFMVASGEKRRSVYDAKNRERLPGALVRSEGQEPTDDKAVNEAYDGAGYTYDFYWDMFNRNSIDDRGMRMISSVHYGVKYDNAFWDGRQMAYGDGDGELFKVGSFTESLDVKAHEMTHGVTDYTAQLVYQGQSGALNESFSDVMGILVKQRVLGQSVDQSDWLIGEGMFAPGINGVAIRSMKAPGTAYDDPLIGKDPQPDSMNDYVQTDDDDGGVHINSGIPNRAFYLAASEIGGCAWEKAGKIWYAVLKDRLQPESMFADAANATISVAGDLFGEEGPEQAAVNNAWIEVGVLRSSAKSKAMHLRRRRIKRQANKA